MGRRKPELSRRRVITTVMTPTQAEKAGKKLNKVEYTKEDSDQLRHPVEEEMLNDEIFVTERAYQILKFHGTYQQDDRELRRAGEQKKYQFMLRLKMPGGEMPASMYSLLEDLSENYGNHTLRATTRSAFQMHGVLKDNLKTVFSQIMNAGGSCIGACGDLNRNIVATPAQFTSKPYQCVRKYAAEIAEVFAPQSSAFAEVWLDGEKAGAIEYWKKDMDFEKIQEILKHDNGNGVADPNHSEPIYRDTYLPRKFKIGITVPGDNSIDIYTQDIGIIVMTTKTGRLQGFNLMVGGGLGRTHRKENTFPRLADHLGFVEPQNIFEVLKAIVAVQRDHGNREVRMNARMKYLIQLWGIDKFRDYVEQYSGVEMLPYKKLPTWKYEDWLGWHEQGDGNYFLGLFVENGRIKNEDGFNLKSALRDIVRLYNLPVVVSPNQNLILKNINPADKDAIEKLLMNAGVKFDSKDFSRTRLLAMACPALPLCGLATAEAERVMPDTVSRLEDMLRKLRIRTPITTRMTGCPNGCARPYVAEIGLVGNGPNMYQLWLGASANQTRLAWVFQERMNLDDFERTLEPIFIEYKKSKRRAESFGDFCDRAGKEELERVVNEFDPSQSLVKTTAKPRVSVTTETMDRLTRISDIRGLSPSKLANEILEQYIDSLETTVHAQK